MFAHRGRGGPSRSTPANVQCQKCLKRDMSRAPLHVILVELTHLARHYSYECKASAHERPYVSRPSRSQQLRNPKLVPKLASDTPNPLEKKKGVADEELAKIEAERARKRELEEREDELVQSDSRRRRSVSSHSVSTISTDASRASPSPVRRTRSPKPQRRGRSPESGSDEGRPNRRSRSYSRSPPPPRRRRRSVPRDSRSPRRESSERDYRDRGGYDASPDRPRRDDPRSKHGSDSRRGQSYASRSPDSHDRHHGQRDDRGCRHGNTRNDRGDGGRQAMPVEQTPRERSLSPFSKRLALTQSLNMGGR